MVNKLPKYEYKIIPLPQFLPETQETLKSMSGDMWELVTVFTPPNVDFYYETAKQQQPSPFLIFRRIMG